MDELGGTQRVLAATTAMATSTALWDAGELSQQQYVDAVMLGNGISSGLVPVVDGLRALMGLWMLGPLAGLDGLESFTY